MQTLSRLLITIISLTTLLIILAMMIGTLLNSPEIAFQSGDHFNDEIYRMDIRTRIPFNLSRHSGRDVSPSWLPDGTALSFSSDRNMGSDLDIYTVHADGWQIDMLNDMPLEAYSLIWSPDGTRMAYLGGIGTYTDVFVMDENGDTRQLTRNGITSGLGWSPNSSQLVYINAHQNNPDLFIVSVDGGQPQRLTRGVMASSPVWVANGTHIAYTAVENDTRHVYTIDIETGEIREVLTAPDVWIIAWSPDATRLAYVAGEIHMRDLYVATFMPNNTLQVQQLTDGMVTGAIAWHQDGDRLVFAARPQNAGQTELYMMHTDWQTPRRLTYNNANDLYPIWRPE